MSYFKIEKLDEGYNIFALPGFFTNNHDLRPTLILKNLRAKIVFEMGYGIFILSDDDKMLLLLPTNIKFALNEKSISQFEIINLNSMECIISSYGLMFRDDIDSDAWKALKFTCFNSENNFKVEENETECNVTFNIKNMLKYTSKIPSEIDDGFIYENILKYKVYLHTVLKNPELA